MPYWVVTKGWVTGIFQKEDKARRQIDGYEGGGMMVPFENMQDAMSFFQPDDNDNDVKLKELSSAFVTPTKRKLANNLYDRLKEEAEQCKKVKVGYETTLIYSNSNNSNSLHANSNGHKSKINVNKDRHSTNCETIMSVIEQKTVNVDPCDIFLNWTIEKRRKDHSTLHSASSIQMTCDPQNYMVSISCLTDPSICIQKISIPKSNKSFWFQAIEKVLLLCPNAVNISINNSIIYSFFQGVQWKNYLKDIECPYQCTVLSHSESLRLMCMIQNRSIIWSSTD